MKKKMLLFISIFTCCFIILFSIDLVKKRIYINRRKVDNSQIISGNSSGNIMAGGELAQYKNWLYFSNQESGGKIYRKNIDGLNLKRLNNAKSDNINVTSKKIYYRKVEKHAIYRMNLDGSDDEIVYKGMINELSYHDGYLYFTESCKEGNNLCRIKTEEGKKELLINENIEHVTVLDDWIYFTEIGSNSIYRLSILNGEKELLHKGSGIFVVEKTGIFFLDEGKWQLCKMNLDGTHVKEIKKCVPKIINVVDKFLFYTEGKDIYIIESSGSAKKVVDNNNPIIRFYVTDNALMYTYLENKNMKEIMKQKFLLF